VNLGRHAWLYWVSNAVCTLWLHESNMGPTARARIAGTQSQPCPTSHLCEDTTQRIARGGPADPGAEFGL
jgi:hypothetical protein